MAISDTAKWINEWSQKGSEEANWKLLLPPLVFHTLPIISFKGSQNFQTFLCGAYLDFVLGFFKLVLLTKFSGWFKIKGQGKDGREGSEKFCKDSFCEARDLLRFRWVLCWTRFAWKFYTNHPRQGYPQTQMALAEEMGTGQQSHLQAQ